MYRVDEALCTGCGDCIDVCPSGAITLVNGKARIDALTCAECGSCAAACPQGAIVMAVTADLAHASFRPAVPVSALVPVRASTGTAVEALPRQPRYNRLWPMIGGALVWASRELLPEVIASWRTARVARPRPTGDRLRVSSQRMATHRRNSRRHRWGRV